MPRRRVVAKRRILPDPKFQDRLVSKFMNDLMRKGKKSTAEQICYGAFSIMEEKTKEDPLKLFKKALDNVKPALEDSIKSLTPVLEVRSRRVGGATYQVPVEVPSRRARTLAVRWLIEFSRRRREKTMAERLAGELLDAQSDQGGAWKRKDDIYRMAQANKAFAHYRW